MAMQMIRLAVGPALAASFISEGVYKNVNLIGASLLVISLILILPPVVIHAGIYKNTVYSLEI